MPISNGGFIEIADNAGSSVAYSGTATTSVVNVPASPDKIIAQAIVTTSDNNFQISFDNGVTYFTMNKNDSLSLEVKGLITQIKIKTSTGTAGYKMIVNFEDT